MDNDTTKIRRRAEERLASQRRLHRKLRTEAKKDEQETKRFFLEQGEFYSAKKPNCFRNKKNLILELRARADSRLALRRRLHLSSCEVLVHRLLRDTKKLVRWPKELREAIRATFSQ